MNVEETAGVATQLVFEYPEWGCEHTSDMFNTYQETGQPEPCEYWEFEQACIWAQRHKNCGLDYFQTQKAVQKQLKTEMEGV